MGRVLTICSSSMSLLNSLIKTQTNRKTEGSFFLTYYRELPASNFIFFCLVGWFRFATGRASISKCLATVIWRQSRHTPEQQKQGGLSLSSPVSKLHCFAGRDRGLDPLAAWRGENMAWLERGYEQCCWWVLHAEHSNSCFPAGTSGCLSLGDNFCAQQSGRATVFHRATYCSMQGSGSPFLRELWSNPLWGISHLSDSCFWAPTVTQNIKFYWKQRVWHLKNKIGPAVYRGTSTEGVMLLWSLSSVRILKIWWPLDHF